MSLYWKKIIIKKINFLAKADAKAKTKSKSKSKKGKSSKVDAEAEADADGSGKSKKKSKKSKNSDAEVEAGEKYFFIIFTQNFLRHKNFAHIFTLKRDQSVHTLKYSIKIFIS